MASLASTVAFDSLSPREKRAGRESWREGQLIKRASSSRPTPPFLRRRGRECTVACSKQIFCRTQLAGRLCYPTRCGQISARARILLLNMTIAHAFMAMNLAAEED